MGQMALMMALMPIQILEEVKIMLTKKTIMTITLIKTMTMNMINKITSTTMKITAVMATRVKFLPSGICITLY